MNRYILRKENFGGLLFDRKACEIKLVDDNEFDGAAGNVDIIMRENKGFSTLSAPTRVFLVLTKKCNLHCVHCSNSSGSSRVELLEYKEIESILSQFVEMGVFEIAINGGEPLCHPNFFGIISLVKEKGFPIYLNTNGVCSWRNLVKLSESGVENIKVSIDGLEGAHDAIRGKGTFKKAVASIIYLKEKNNVRINFTLTKKNKDNVFGVIKLADELGCDLKIAPMVKVGRAKSLTEPEFLIEEGIEISRQVADFCKDSDIKIKVEKASDLTAKHCPEIIEEFHYQYTECGIRRTHMSVDSDGSIYATGRQTDFEREGAIGNIREESIKQLWDKIKIMNEVVKNGCDKCENSQAESLLIESFKTQS